MPEVKRSTEHSLELGNVTIKIDSPDDDIISIQTKDPGYPNYMRLKIADINTLMIALTQFDTWLETQNTKG